MSRAFLVVLDSVGIGGAPDAAAYGDAGANTVGHILEQTGVALPNLTAMGLRQALALADEAFQDAIHLHEDDRIVGINLKGKSFWGCATEQSKGKDTPTGHWELAGVPVPWEWHYFPDTTPSFPENVVRRVCDIAGTDGILGNCHASGTEIIDRLGVEHLTTGWPICYTSADSVFQIAAHEETFGLDRLLDLCQRLAEPLHAMRVGRVIARPFVGSPGAFVRTSNRRDFAIEPPKPTLCDWATQSGRKVYGIGKIADIFSNRGISDSRKGPDTELMEHLISAAKTVEDGALVFANFVEFDSIYGHRRDVDGYAQHLTWFDARLPEVLASMRADDLLIVTADHGNDPTWHGTEHTRERVPILGIGPRTGSVGHVAFQDVAASVAAHLKLMTRGEGRSFL